MSAGEVIRRHREAKGISLRALAKLAGLSPAYMSGVERGTIGAKLTEKSIMAISHALVMDSEQLFCLAGRMPSDIHRRALQSTTHLQAVRELLNRLP